MARIQLSDDSCFVFSFFFVISTTQNWTLAYALHTIGKCKLVLFIRRWMRPGWWFMQHGRKLPNFPTLSLLRNYSLTLSIQHTVHNAHKYLQAATLPKPCQQQIKFVFSKPKAQEVLFLEIMDSTFSVGWSNTSLRGVSLLKYNNKSIFRHVDSKAKWNAIM